MSLRHFTTSQLDQTISDGRSCKTVIRHFKLGTTKDKSVGLGSRRRTEDYERCAGGGVSSDVTLLPDDKKEEEACCELKPFYLQLFKALHVPPFYILNLVL